MGSIDTTSETQDVDILIIGGGLSGCYALYKLRQLTPAPTIKLLEAGQDFGGVWHWNRYPGARVDSEWPCYQLSIPEVWKDWRFDTRFPDHYKLREYIKHMDQVLDLRRDAVFNTIVNSVMWNAGDERWESHTKDGKAYRSRYLIVCAGSSYKKHYPNLRGLHNFKGVLLHSAAFPEEKMDVTAKRVGVVGSGATGVQIIQELAKHDCQLVNFLRTPNMAVPLRQRPISEEEEKGRKADFAQMFNSLRNSRSGFPVLNEQVPFNDITEDERQAILQDCWDRGGFAFLTDTFPEHLYDDQVNRYMYRFWADKVRARITDPQKRELMAPLEQEHFFGTRRTALETDYYESLDRPNVQVVSVKKNPIKEITAEGVLLEDGALFELDMLILATGFDAMNGSQMALGLQDRHGVSLREKWSHGTETYLGLTIPGCPNLFMSYGPQAPTAIGNGPTFIETAVDWMFDVMTRMAEQNIATVEPRPEAAKKWAQDIKDATELTFLAKEETGWWMSANIPGKFKEQLNYLGGNIEYTAAITEALDGWKGFEVVPKT